jgi:hypothetical protein
MILQKIQNKFLIILIFSITAIWADINTSVNSKSVNLGESVTLKIQATGSDIKFDDIYEICKSNIESSSSSQSISMISGTVTKQVAKTYLFTPQSSCTIEPINIKIDGKNYKSDKIDIEVNKDIQQTKNEFFLLELIANKKEAYLYEPIEITIKLTRDKLKDILDIKLGETNFEGFWVKQTKKEKAYKDGKNIVHELYYTLYPQKTGNITINPINANIAIEKMAYDTFGFIARNSDWQRIYSNKIDLKIKDIPKGVSLVGDFDITTSVDRTSIDENEAVNLKLNINGKGNFDDISKYDLKIDNTNIYSDKPTNKDSNFSQSFAIVANSSYTIPSMQIKYFSLKDKKVIIKKTKEIKINVKKLNNDKPIIEKNLKNEEITTKKLVYTDTKLEDRILYFILGIIFSIGLYLIYLYIKQKKLENIKIFNKMFPKDIDKLNLLIEHYGKSKEIDETIKKLEENIYENKSHQIKFTKQIKEYIR